MIVRICIEGKGQKQSKVSSHKERRWENKEEQIRS